MSQHIEKSGEIDAPIEKVYQTVADVARYPEFLPGMNDVRVNGDIIEMTVSLGPTKVSWKSRATYVPNQSVTFTLVEGPFRQLDGKWEFSANGNKTHIKYTTDFELTLSIPGINQIAAKAIEANTNAIIEAFRKRLAML